MERAMVIVGRKKAIRYVTACITLFNRGQKEIVLRARGRNIENCIRTVMLLKKGFYSELKIREVAIGSDMVGRGKRRYVSYMEIVIGR
ncbi:MAG TPA: RNA-binding protein [Nitrososphaeria archaeon]|nr:MAG: RNA-binding protein [Nitrososphaerota archaeon]HDJ67238.1 RNA-binding protein [Nitrososphaeria archaeon]